MPACAGGTTNQWLPGSTPGMAQAPRQGRSVTRKGPVMDPDQVGALVIIAFAVGALVGDFTRRTPHKPSSHERRRIVWIDGYPYVEGKR
jgi:hypothetical protein